MYDETYDETEPLAGSLLIAHPSLKDPNFASSVVLLTQHEESGSLGVVLNQSTGKCLEDLSSEFSIGGLGQVPVYVGGPVNPNQIILAAWKHSPEQGQFQLYFGMEPVVAQSKMEEDPDLVFRAFKGYSGWSEGQLAGELNSDVWVISDVDADSISSMEGQDLWRYLILESNPELGLLTRVPEDLELN